MPQDEFQEFSTRHNSISISRTVAESRTKQLKSSLGQLDKVSEADTKNENDDDDSNQYDEEGEKQKTEFQWLRRRRVDGALNRMQEY